MLKGMMKHSQVTIPIGVKSFGVCESTLIAYRGGQITISHASCMRIISALEPSPHMRVVFMSACQAAALEAWRMVGKDKK
jgi:hypothetical protein